MPVDTDLLGNCGLRLDVEIYSDGSYSLCRVDYQGRKLIAEISDTSGVYQHRWPAVGGLITPISSRDLPGGRKLVLFDLEDGEFLCETLAVTGSFPQDKALELTNKVLAIVSNLQAAGMICGYLGPEMFVSQGSQILMLAGRRGVPNSPFTAPEVQHSRPSDPRSDVSAIGSFLFRLVAGTDARKGQFQAWEKLDPSFQAVITDMVAALPVNRPNGLRVVGTILDNLTAGTHEQIDTDTVQDDSLFAKPGSVSNWSTVASSRRKKIYWVAGSVAVLAAAYFAVISSGLPSERDVSVQPVLVDSIVDESDEVVSPWVEDTLPVFENTDSVIVLGVRPEDTARVWISNCTGVPDLELDFRSGPARDYSYVYPLIGTSNRQSSLILVRRPDPTISVSGSALGQAAFMLADTLFTVKPVDLTMLLGTDLNYSGINNQFLHQPVAPSGTLFVDVVNHGIQYTLDNMGAATWVASSIDGKACDIDGVEWLITVSDIRDADHFSEEIGIPELLEETLFLQKQSNLPVTTLEVLLRQFFQALPSGSNFPMEAISVPDIHILMGAPSRG